MTHAEMVKSGNWHAVTNKKRAKLLRDRGENIKWSIKLDCWIWNFQNRKTKKQ